MKNERRNMCGGVIYLLGLCQWIKRRKLLKVDFDIRMDEERTCAKNTYICDSII